jgi:hypothetical protein
MITHHNLLNAFTMGGIMRDVGLAVEHFGNFPEFERTGFFALALSCSVSCMTRSAEWSEQAHLPIRF